jgi:N-acetylneuraminic acid mutarotase
LKNLLEQTFCILLFTLLGMGAWAQAPTASVGKSEYFDWSSLPSVPAVGKQKTVIGTAGAIAGISHGTIIFAGGANFDRPFWEHEKAYHDDILVFSEDSTWKKVGNLPYPLAYSATATTPWGIVAIGGHSAEEVFDNVLLINWDKTNSKPMIVQLPNLPSTCTNGSATVLGDHIYVAGGQATTDLDSTMKNFWRLDMSKQNTDDFTWEVLPAWTGPGRAYNLTVAQHNGYENCIYVMSGRRVGRKTPWQVLEDVHEFSPERYAAGHKQPWRKRQSMPSPRMAGSAVAIGQSHVFVLTGADGSLYQAADTLKEQHPGFPKQIYAYNTITNTWFEAGNIPENQVTSHAFKHGEDIIIASGEVKPRTRSPKVLVATPVRTAHSFGAINIGAIVIYLLLLVGIGVYFSFRNKNTEDFFRGGQRIPWWAAGCSIFATILSSLTFMSIPAKTYSTDWVYFGINLCIVLLAPFIIYYILPFFRKIDATSAYEYLEKRFNLACRLFASASYILFQIGRMAIVMYLPSLALATVTPISIEICILLMGLLSILYSALGGLEAVIWTDTIQTLVLFSGAILSLLLIFFGNDIGPANFFEIAIDD